MIRFRAFFLTFASLVITINSFATCNDWERLIHYPYVSLSDAARDHFGNLYVAGSFHEQDLVLGQYTFTLPPGGGGAFIAKFDKNYLLMWAMSPVAERAHATEVEIDQNDNIVVAGFYYTSIDFGCLSLSGSDTPRSDIFVVSITKDGMPLWVTGSSGSDDETPSALTISPNGNIILGCQFVEKSDVTQWLSSPDVAIGGVPVITGSSDQLNAGYDSFVACIQPNGSVAWTQGIGGDGNQYDYLMDVTTDKENNIILTGLFSSDQISFDGHIVHRFTTSENYYLAKLDPNGQTMWVREGEGGVDQSGWGLEADDDGNIFVSGRYYGHTKFGNLNLVNNGSADVFVVKVSPAGTALAARGIGNDGFDAGTNVELNSSGQVLLSAYYTSDYLEVGDFSSIKSGYTDDSFIATLSNDLAIVECANFITGDASSVVWRFELDPADNALVLTDLFLSEGSAFFGALSISAETYWSALGILGNNAIWDAEPPHEDDSPPISLGPDRTICPQEQLQLSPGHFCNATYNWSNGSHEASIEVDKEGIYWVEVTIGGKTGRDEIQVIGHSPLELDLGENKTICAGGTVTLTAPHYEHAIYLWSDGSNAETKTITQAGNYSLTISNICETVADDVDISFIAEPAVDLGNDRMLCDGAETILSYNPAEGETIEWSDGSTGSALRVAQPGTYSITISNGCATATDEITLIGKSSPVVQLGEEQQLCDGKEVVLTYQPQNDETLQWSDGSSGASLPVNSPGVYSIVVTNVCGSSQDEVAVTVKDAGASAIPNVVTPNGDGMNDQFILPEVAAKPSVVICNRWGENIFSAEAYENNWPQAELNPGVYFYYIQGICVSARKGTIQVLR